MRNNNTKDEDCLPFLKQLLKFEKDRIDKYYNLTENPSFYEEINEEFGIFPHKKLYPMYFYGSISSPKNKYIFIGINPSYTGDIEEKETIEIEKSDYFDWLSNAFLNWKENYNGVLFSYLKKIALFLNGIDEINDKNIIDYDWLHKNVINLELVPYHSGRADGLSINNPEKYSRTYFEILRKIIEYIRPQRPIIIFGFSIIETLEMLKQRGLVDDIEIDKKPKDQDFYAGKFFGYAFICLKFRFGHESLYQIKPLYNIENKK